MGWPDETAIGRCEWCDSPVPEVNVRWVPAFGPPNFNEERTR